MAAGHELVGDFVPDCGNQLREAVMDKRIKAINDSMMGEVRKWMRHYEREIECVGVKAGPVARDLANIVWCIEKAARKARDEFEDVFYEEAALVAPKTAPLKPGESDGFAPSNDLQSATVRGQDEYNRMRSGMFPRR